MKEEEILYHQSGNTITCIIWYKNNTPLQFIKKNFIGFNQTVITDLEYSNLVKMRPMDAKDYFIQLWCRYNKEYFNFTPNNSYLLVLWKINRISDYVRADSIVIDTKNQKIRSESISRLNTHYDVEISEEEYQEVIQLTELDNFLGFIQAVSVFTKYTGKTIDEINFRSI